MQKLINNANGVMSVLVFLAIPVVYSNEFFIGLKVISCGIE